MEEVGLPHGRGRAMAREAKGWLGQRIEQAQKEVDSWPDWMKEASRFEGSKSSVRPESTDKAIVVPDPKNG